MSDIPPGHIKTEDLNLSWEDREAIRICSRTANMKPVYCEKCQQIHLRMQNDDGTWWQLGKCGAFTIKS